MNSVNNNELYELILNNIVILVQNMFLVHKKGDLCKRKPEMKSSYG